MTGKSNYGDENLTECLWIQFSTHKKLERNRFNYELTLIFQWSA